MFSLKYMLLEVSCFGRFHTFPAIQVKFSCRKSFDQRLMWFAVSLRFAVESGESGAQAGIALLPRKSPFSMLFAPFFVCDGDFGRVRFGRLACLSESVTLI